MAPPEISPALSVSLMDFYKSVPLLENLTEEEVEELEKIVTTQVYHPGDVCFKEGDNGRFLIIVVSGRIAMSRRLAGDKVLSMGELRRGQSFGEEILLDKGEYLASGMALETTEAFLVQRMKLQILYHDALGAWAKLYYNLARSVMERYQALLRLYGQVENEVRKLETAVGPEKGKDEPGAVKRFLRDLFRPHPSEEIIDRLIGNIREKQRLLG